MESTTTAQPSSSLKVCHVPGFATHFLDVKNYVTDVTFSDPGLEAARRMASGWIASGSRTVNQYSYDGLMAPGTQFSKDELATLATYMWSVSQAIERPSPSPTVRLRICWESAAGALQPSGRRRISYGGSYKFNYVFNATVAYGPSPPGTEWSHLCGNSACERPSHLHAESHGANVKRIGCPGNIYCPATGDVWDVCGCLPKCMKYTTVGTGPTTIAQHASDLHGGDVVYE